MERPSELRFRVIGRVLKDGPGGIPKKGSTVWLGFTEEGGGWYEWYGNEKWAYPFRDKESARIAASKTVGPWYSLPDKRSIKIQRGTYYPACVAIFEPDEKVS